MCGIVGVFGQLTMSHENTFSDMLIFDQVRGFDSTGVCIVNRINPISRVFKGVMSPAYLLNTPYYREMTKTSLLCMIGHNRAATKGTVIDKNAHPFIHEHITGVHNGTATSTSNLLDHEKFDVDSDNIFYHISQKGAKDMWKNFYGAAALVWWDDKEKALFLLRNSQRPLHMAMTNDEQCLIWSSEEEILIAAAARRKVAHGTIVEATPNNIYKYTFDKKVILETEECPSYVPDYGASFYGNWGYDRQAYESRTKAETQGSEEELDVAITFNSKIPETYKGRTNYSSRSTSPGVNGNVATYGDVRAYNAAQKTIDDIEDVNEAMFPFRWLRSRSHFCCSMAMTNFLNILDGKINSPAETIQQSKPY